MAEITPAPGELELVRQFVNSADVEQGTDELSTSEQLTAWLKAHDLPGPSGGIDKEALRRAVDMREAIRCLLFANAGDPLDRSAIASLNRASSEARLTVRFDEHGHPSLEPGSAGVDAALAALLAIVFRSMADGTWPRLKACQEDTCQWAFYDESRNRSAHWCSMEVCGNRNKARRFRERRRDTKQA